MLEHKEPLNLAISHCSQRVIEQFSAAGWSNIGAHLTISWKQEAPEEDSLVIGYSISVLVGRARPDQAILYRALSEGKILSLRENPSYRSSRESNLVGGIKLGGAVRGLTNIYSVAGFSMTNAEEDACETLALLLAISQSELTLDEAWHIARNGENRFYEQFRKDEASTYAGAL